MKIQCAWCGLELPGSAEPAPGETDAVSHGICTDCARTLLGESGVPLHQFLRGLDVPVMLLTGKGRLVDVNAQRGELVGDRVQELRGLLVGEVFKCVNAELPGGCGKTVHCSGCVLRSTIENTYRTGESQVRVPATVEVRRNDGPEEADFLVTTARVGQHVVVRMDRVEEEAAAHDGGSQSPSAVESAPRLV